MGNKRWYDILTQAYGVDWELDDGFQWLNMSRWYDLSLQDIQVAISKYMDKQSLADLSAHQIKYLVDRYGLRQVAERVEDGLKNKHRVHTVNFNNNNERRVV